MDKSKVDADFVKSFDFMAKGAQDAVNKSMEKVCTQDQCKLVQK